MTVTLGPVPLNALEYVPRKFERDALAHALRREWVLILGPRQHGKTSALIRIRQELGTNGFRCAFVDLQKSPPGMGFRELLQWFAREVAKSLGGQLLSSPAWGRDSLEDWLALSIASPSAPVVILIDEASAIRDDEIRNSFFGQIRALKSAGAAAEPGSLLTAVQFIFAGTFRPETLVNELNSPFNVCRRLETEDITKEEVLELAKMALAQDEVDDVVDVVFDSVGGQPHLVQSLLSIAAAHDPAARAAAVQLQIAEWISRGSDHLDSIFSVVVQEPSILSIVGSALAAGRALNEPASVDCKFLTVLGLMKRDGQNLVFRNHVYKEVAGASPQLRPEQAVLALAGPFFQADISSFAFVADAEYREICYAAHSGAVLALNAGSFRLALVGFGVSLEAMLIDKLLQQNPAALSTAIGATTKEAKPNFDRWEDPLDPSTWRLVNLMKVARLLNRVRGPLEVSESLREMRNFVHPKLLKKRYMVESDLAPEAYGAGSLVAQVKRDVQLP